MEIEQLYIAFLNATEISTDTRTLKKGALFFALSGPNFDGNRFAKEALAKNLKIFEILWDRERLKERINLRTALMLKDGIIDELQSVKPVTYSVIKHGLNGLF